MFGWGKKKETVVEELKYVYYIEVNMMVGIDIRNLRIRAEKGSSTKEVTEFVETLNKATDESFVNISNLFIGKKKDIVNLCFYNILDK